MLNRFHYSGIHFGKSGMTPRFRSRVGPNLPEDEKKRIQDHWESLVEAELEHAPDFVQSTLRKVKKRKVNFGWVFGL
jgi:hypothetical protein